MDGDRKKLRAVVFDLDEALLDSRRAWQYTIEEALVSVTGRRIEAGPLVDEYRRRPWRDALAVLLASSEERERAEQLCGRMYERSGMKKLLVHEGLGMALDELRAGRLEMGAITRRPHAIAMRQIESTGLDRFLTVLAPTPGGEPWDAPLRIAECARFLTREMEHVAFVSPDDYDLKRAAAAGAACYGAGWCGAESAEFLQIEAVRELGATLIVRSAPATSRAPGR
ncbi:hypothetical protein AYO38_00320 [bacterium SCGC AG-212-C10]|nr:hypothetical protein AYO38_00320 [bacterium SCGC AG-212-C10]